MCFVTVPIVGGGAFDAPSKMPLRGRTVEDMNLGMLATGKHLNFRFAALCNTPEGKAFCGSGKQPPYGDTDGGMVAGEAA